MTGVDNDLATLRDRILMYGADCPSEMAALAALSRVETELARLERELENADTDLDGSPFLPSPTEELAAPAIDYLTSIYPVASNEDARDSITALVSTLKAAEARVAHLEQGLRRFYLQVASYTGGDGSLADLVDAEREARSLLDDNQGDKTPAPRRSESPTSSGASGEGNEPGLGAGVLDDTELQLAREDLRADKAEVTRLREGLRRIERMAGAAGAGEVPAMPIAAEVRSLLADNQETGFPHGRDVPTGTLGTTDVAS